MTDTVPSGDDLEVGDEGPELVVESVSRKDIVRFAGASGDFNPIHYHEEAAREAGHPGVIAQGMFTSGLVETMVTDWVGIENVRSFGVQFTDIVQPGDSIRVVGEVEEKSVEDDEIIVVLALRAKNQNDETVVKGEATAAFTR